jgi:hypothetical protein
MNQELKKAVLGMCHRWGYSPDEALEELRLAASNPDRWQLIATNDAWVHQAAERLLNGQPTGEREGIAQTTIANTAARMQSSQS